MCNRDCFNCPYDDCVEEKASSNELAQVDRIEKQNMKMKINPDTPYSTKGYYRDPESCRKRSREYYQKNKEKCKENQKKYYYENKDKFREYWRKYRESHREELRLKQIEYRQRRARENNKQAETAVGNIQGSE